MSESYDKGFSSGRAIGQHEVHMANQSTMSILLESAFKCGREFERERIKKIVIEETKGDTLFWTGEYILDRIDRTLGK